MNNTSQLPVADSSFGPTTPLSQAHIQASGGFADKLAYALATKRVLGSELEWLPAFKQHVRASVTSGVCLPFFGPTGRYRYGFFLATPSGARVLVMYGVRDMKRQRYGVRIECNPATMSAEDISCLHRFFGLAFTRNYRALLRHCRIARVDFAVDLRGAKLDVLLVGYSRAQTLTTFGKTARAKGGQIETLMFGSVKSDTAAAVYAKDIERAQRRLDSVARVGTDDRLADNVLRQLPMECGPVVRLEVRFRKQKLSVAALQQLENRFERFKFIERCDTSFLPPITRQAFWSMCRDLGVKAAIRWFAAHTTYGKQLKALLRSLPVWWAPDVAWREALADPRMADILSPKLARLAGESGGDQGGVE